MLTQAMAGRIVTAAMQRLGEAPALLGPREFAQFWAEDRAAIRAILPRLPRE
jgi:hypothetical protein